MILNQFASAVEKFNNYSHQCRKKYYSAIYIYQYMTKNFTVIVLFQKYSLEKSVNMSGLGNSIHVKFQIFPIFLNFFHSFAAQSRERHRSFT